RITEEEAFYFVGSPSISNQGSLFQVGESLFVRILSDLNPTAAAVYDVLAPKEATNKSIAHISTSYQAVAAATGLVAIQVGLGVILKLAQNDGSYSFSTSGSVSISEFGKLILSTILFCRECSHRIARGMKPRTHTGGDYESPPLTSTPGASSRGQNGRDEDDEEEYFPHVKLQYNMVDAKLSPAVVWRYFRGEVTDEKQAGFYILALCYTLINNSIFLSYYLADPGTIQLSKSSGALMTAVIMVVSLKTALSRIQWATIFLQVFGLILSQYKPGIGSAYPATTYAILFFQVFISASSAVYNQRLLKTDNNSMHADNMILYAFGTVINLVCHLFIFTMAADEPSFFVGYSDIRAILVVVSHAFVGVAITYVYKCRFHTQLPWLTVLTERQDADAVVKCLATAVATGILLFLSPILFGSELGSLVIPGTLIVFASSWLYMMYPASTSQTADHDSKRLPKYWRVILGLLTVVTVGIVIAMAVVRDRLPTTSKQSSQHAVHESKDDEVVSPFHDVLAMVRWNSAHPERVPQIIKYEPFFDTVHISMPGMMPDQPETFYNWTHDQFRGTFTIYLQVAKTMQMALAEKPHIKGLMYFHFDAWLDPLAWGDTNWDNIWIANGSTPPHQCITSTRAYDWWGWASDLHLKLMNASAAVQQLGLGYKVNTKEWCLGWSDIYYIPRRFFADYILLADVYNQFDAFHELAIPTMLNIINNSQQSNTSVVKLVEDCWGSCCDTIAKPDQVLKNRCGHRLDYLNQPAVDQYYAKLDAQAKLTGLMETNFKYQTWASSSISMSTSTERILPFHYLYHEAQVCLNYSIRTMQAVPTGSLILVTGVNGYIASHVAEQLLEHGFRVRGTVRDVGKANYMHALFDQKYGFETLVVEDMAMRGAFDEAVKGCAGVMHLATDLTLNPDPNKVIPMVLSGVRNALTAAAAETSVKRFVFTSSSAAVTPYTRNKRSYVDSTSWNEREIEDAWAPPPYNDDRKLAVYAASKALAEKECWRFVQEEKPAFVLNTVLPNCTIGRILSKEQPASTGGWYRKFWERDESILGLMKNLSPQHYVNATDTALLHVAALREEDVVGERLLAFAGPFNFNLTMEAFERLRDQGYGNDKREFPRIADDDRDLKIVDTTRSQELLKRYNRPAFADLDMCLKEVIESSEGFQKESSAYRIYESFTTVGEHDLMIVETASDAGKEQDRCGNVRLRTGSTYQASSATAWGYVRHRAIHGGFLIRA
ncbi:hypothetical protein L249_3151, partial [Ophiocordyceps polyrhachis-furcata BCC 54312]